MSEGKFCIIWEIFLTSCGPRSARRWDHGPLGLWLGGWLPDIKLGVATPCTSAVRALRLTCSVLLDILAAGIAFIHAGDLWYVRLIIYEALWTRSASDVLVSCRQCNAPHAWPFLPAVKPSKHENVLAFLLLQLHRCTIMIWWTPHGYGLGSAASSRLRLPFFGGLLTIPVQKSFPLAL